MRAPPTTTTTGITRPDGTARTTGADGGHGGSHDGGRAHRPEGGGRHGGGATVATSPDGRDDHDGRNGHGDHSGHGGGPGPRRPPGGGNGNDGGGGDGDGEGQGHGDGGGSAPAPGGHLLYAAWHVATGRAGQRPAARPDPVRPRVILIDPEQWTRVTLATALAEAGCEVVALRSGMTAGYVLTQQPPTVVVAEIDLPPAGTWGGLMLLADLAKQAPGVPLLVIARPEAAHLAGRAVTAGARRMLPKSDVRGLVAAVAEAHAEFVRAAYPRGGAGGRDTGRPG